MSIALGNNSLPSLSFQLGKSFSSFSENEQSRHYINLEKMNTPCVTSNKYFGPLMNAFLEKGCQHKFKLDFAIDSYFETTKVVKPQI